MKNFLKKGSVILVLMVMVFVSVLKPVTVDASSFSPSFSPYVAPVSTWPSTGGYLNWLGSLSKFPGKVHVGMDLKANTCVPVRAVLDGLVVSSAIRSGYGPNFGPGGCVVVKHINKYRQPFYAIYGHVFATVQTGQYIGRDQVLGYVNDFSPSHLHFGISSAAEPTGYAYNSSGFFPPFAYLEMFCK